MSMENKRKSFKKGHMVSLIEVQTKLLVAKDLSTANFQVAQELIMQRDKDVRRNREINEVMKGRVKVELKLRKRGDHIRGIRGLGRVIKYKVKRILIIYANTKGNRENSNISRIKE